MLATILMLDRWAEGWLKVMGAAFWQSALLIAVASIIAWCLRRNSPIVRYWLWQIVAIKLLLMPFWTFSVPFPTWWESNSPKPVVMVQPAESLVGDSGLKSSSDSIPIIKSPSIETPPQAGSFWEPFASITWQAWLMAAWFAAILCLIFRLSIQRWQLSQLLKRGMTASGELAALVAELSGQIGIRRVPATVSIAGDCPVFVCGLWRPVLVMPDRLMASLDPSERRQVILHELGHVRRHDLAWGWTVEIARIVYFFNPLVYWAAFQLRLERELACDQLAMVRSGHSPADYARTLVQVVSHASNPAASQIAAISAGLTGNQSAMKQPSPPNEAKME